MWEQILPGLRIKIFMTVVLGVVYPLVMTGISQVIFPKQANGSLITVGDKVIGSEIIGQNFTKPEYFHPRPSAAGGGYDATSSSGTNLGADQRQAHPRHDQNGRQEERGGRFRWHQSSHRPLLPGQRHRL